MTRKTLFIFLLLSGILLLGACSMDKDDDDDSIEMFEEKFFAIKGYIDDSNEIKKLNEVYGLQRKSGTSVYFFKVETEPEITEHVVNSIIFSARTRGKTILDTNDRALSINGKLDINIISNTKVEVYYNDFKCICENYSLKSK